MDKNKSIEALQFHHDETDDDDAEMIECIGAQNWLLKQM